LNNTQFLLIFSEDRYNFTAQQEKRSDKPPDILPKATLSDAQNTGRTTPNAAFWRRA
jgi:hypothetical protein